MPSGDSKDRNEIDTETPVTTIIQQRPLPDAIGRYEDWLKEITPIAQRFCGYQGVNVIRPHAGLDAYTIVLHFDSVTHLRDWLASDIRQGLVAKIRPFLHADENIEIKTGFEFWFTPPPGGKPAKAYKQFLITLSAIYPLTIIVPLLLHPLFVLMPPLALSGISHLLIAAIIVALMVYVIMPRYTRLMSRWLYESTP